LLCPAIVGLVKRLHTFREDIASLQFSKELALNLNQNQLNAFHNYILYFPEIHFNIILLIFSLE
jgi:hypothetical protein